MTVVWRTITFALGLACLSVMAGPVVAQDTTQVRRDSVVRDTTPTVSRKDSLGRDSAALAAEQDSIAKIRARPRMVPIAAAETPRGPLPPGSRYTFTRDSIVWSNSLTLSDLLTQIPGVFLARAGFVGQSEYVMYGGRGARAVEVYWDGMLLPALGEDSIYFDAARVYLTNLRRVDVEVLPATLRVFLVSERHETVDDRSVVRVMSGDYSSAQYAGLFQKRWASGLGIGLAANFVGSRGFSGPGRNDQAFDVNARFEWLPSPRTGVIYQIRRQNQDRDSIGLATGPGAPALHGTRTDSQLRFFASTKPNSDGLGAELRFGSSGWGRDSVIGNQGVHHITGTVRLNASRASLEVTGQVADRRATRSLTARGGFSPLPGIVFSGDATAEQFVGNRSGVRAHGAVALYRGPFSVVGEISRENTVQAPALRLDSAQLTIDQAVRAGLNTRYLTGHVGVSRQDAYAPLPLPLVRVITDFTPSLKSNLFLADFAFQPIRPLTLDGWFANPLRGSADLQPPTHGRAQLTFRSKFWRKFRSGAFDLKVQLAMESWSASTAGLFNGSVVSLNAVTFWETFISFQLVGFTAFWDLRNASNSREEYIPGLPYPRNAQTFGVRWEFFN